MTKTSINSNEKAALGPACLPSVGWDELDRMLVEMGALKAKIDRKETFCIGKRDRSGIERCRIHLRELDEMVLCAFQRKLDILRAAEPVSAPAIWRDVHIWLLKEECRRRVGVDPDSRVLQGQRHVFGRYERAVRGAAYWGFSGWVVVGGWMNSII